MPGIAVQRWLDSKALPAWGPVEPSTGQGMGVEAIVGPGVPMGTGPKVTPDFRPYDYTQLFIAASVGRQYAQGHLLNENLGGPGNNTGMRAQYAAQNLTAFPQWPTNTDHKTVVEKDVKDGVKLGKWFKYEVSISYSEDSAPRLRKRLNLHGAAFDTAWQARTGLSQTSQAYTYASGLTATWQELDNTANSTNSAPILKTGGVQANAGFDIPNPLSFIAPAKRPMEYPPGHIPAGRYMHMETFKASQLWQGTPGAGRVHIAPERWRGVDAARANTPAPQGASATWMLGHTHYNEGVAASRTSTPATRYGRGFTFGYADFDAGITHAHTHALASPPARFASATGHQEYWAGVALGLTKPLTTPPVNNRAHISGHKDYWDGVAHGNQHETPPVGKLAVVEGHNDYWAGVTHALKNPLTSPPVGKLASVAGHSDYRAGVAVALADLTSSLPPGPLGKSKGHADVVAGVTHARANRRGTTPTSSVATTAAFTGYWQGVDHARNNQPGTPCPIPGSAAAAGVADYTAGVTHAVAQASGIAPPAGNTASAEGATDYWAGENLAGLQHLPPPPGPVATRQAFTAFWNGVAHARASLANMQGAAPADRVAGRGFATYCQGVLQHQALQPDNPASPALSLGWTDYDAGESAVRANTVNVGRTDSGYLYAVQNTAAPIAKRKHNDPPGVEPVTKKPR
ncbi:MAG: hypothetical protein ACRDRX_08255 [Pseudonocardiaceae bacterium]